MLLMFVEKLTLFLIIALVEQFISRVDGQAQLKKDNSIEGFFRTTDEHNGLYGLNV